MKHRIDFVWLEGVLEETAARRLLSCVRVDVSHATFKVAGGNEAFWQKVPARNQSAATGMIVVGLADLEQEPCACAVIAKHLPGGVSPRFCLRLAVTMLESWLLADTERMAAFLSAPAVKLPENPDSLNHPKRELVNLARRYGSEALKDDLVPEKGHSGIVGKGYRPRMEEYITKHWRPKVAAQRSPSLQRALNALQNFSRGDRGRSKK